MPTRHEKWLFSCNVAGKLPASGPRLPPRWPSYAGIASKRAVYAGYIRPQRLARRLALPSLSLLLRTDYLVVVLRPSSSLFPAALDEMRFQSMFFVPIPIL